MLRNIFRYSLSSISALFLFVLMFISGRYLGAADFGIFSFALAFILLFDPLLDPGLYHLLIREVSREKRVTQQYLSHSLAWKLMLTPVVFLLVYLTVNLLQKSEANVQAVYLMTAACAIKSLKDAFRSAVLGHEYFGLDAVSLTIERLALLVVGTITLMRGYGLLGLCWVFVFVRLADLVVIGTIVRWKISSISLRLKPEVFKYLLVTGAPIGGYYITVNIYNYVDTIMLSVLTNNQEVGWYNASYKIYEGLVIIPSIISTVFLPRLSVHHKEDKSQFASLFFKGLGYIVMASILVSLLGIPLANEIIALSFGSDYASSVPSLQLLLAGVIFVFVFSFLQTAMIAMDRQKIVLYVALAGLAINVSLNMWLIPQFRHIGAAAATVAAEFIVTSVLLTYILRILTGDKEGFRRMRAMSGDILDARR
jgi:O-antigen/teichoic acid export membrane protein